MPLNQEDKPQTLLDAYAFTTPYTLLSGLLSYPAESFKVRFQLSLDKNSFSVAKQVARQPLAQIYTGFGTFMVKQLFKASYRPPLLAMMNEASSRVNLPTPIDCVCKAVMASLSDVMLGVFFENIKTVQLKSAQAHQNTSVSSAMSSIYQQRGGVKEFFSGSTAMCVKSMPGWLHFFLAYQLYENSDEKKTFLSTLLWAMATTAPIAMFSAPLDTIKTQQQANNLGSLFSTASHI